MVGSCKIAQDFFFTFVFGFFRAPTATFGRESTINEVKSIMRLLPEVEVRHIGIWCNRVAHDLHNS